MTDSICVVVAKFTAHCRCDAAVVTRIGLHSMNTLLGSEMAIQPTRVRVIRMICARSNGSRRCATIKFTFYTAYLNAYLTLFC